MKAFQVRPVPATPEWLRADDTAPANSVNKRGAEEPASCQAPIPLEAFPSWVADYAREVSEELQVDSSAIATLAIGVLSHCCVGRYLARIRPGWNEPVTAYVAFAAEPGERKSAVYKRLFGHLSKVEAEQRGRVESERRAAQGECKALEEAAEVARKEIGKAESEEAKAKARERHKQALAAAAMCAIPALPVPILDDITGEALALAMSDSKGCATVASPEGHGFWTRAAGAYSSSEASQDIFLKGHAGEPVRVTRMSRAPLHIPRALLSITLALQPSVLRSLGSKGFRGTGFLARFLFCAPPTHIGSRNHRSSAVSRLTRERFEHCVSTLADVEVEETLRQVEFSPEARELLIQFLEELEPRHRTDLAPIADWSNKLAGAAARIACMFHVADQAGNTNPWAGSISEDCARRGIAVARAFIPHCQVAFSWVAGGEQRARRDDFERCIRARFGTVGTFTKRDVVRAFRHYDGKTADPLLDSLVDQGTLLELARVGRSRTFRFYLPGQSGQRDNVEAAQ